MCTENRQFPSQDFLSIGASEIISTLLKKGLLDSSVIVGDGCGTVILNDPEKVEGLAGRISGIIKTSPLKKVISFVESSNVLDPNTCEINQIKGVKKAIAKGYKKIAVTVSNAEEIKEIRIKIIDRTNKFNSRAGKTSKDANRIKVATIIVLVVKFTILIFFSMP